jgi:hypothetical protein
MRSIRLSLLVLLSAVLFLAIVAGTEAHAGGAGHSHGHGIAVEVSTAPDRDGDVGIALPGPKEPAAGALNAAKTAGSDTPPCGGEHAEGGKGCCGVACHAAVSQTLVDASFARQASLALRPIRAECRDGRLAFSIERPPRA